MASTKSWRRLASGFAALVAIALLAALATTSVFAFSTSTDQASTVANGGPTNEVGSVSALSLPVASVETVVASYTFASFAPASAPATGIASGTNIRAMYQQWRHDQQNDWFYIYAVNSNPASSSGLPLFDYYYYTPARGATRINSAVSAANNATVGSGALRAAVSYVYLTSGTNVPAFGIEGVTANVAPASCNTTVLGARCPASFTVALRWGVAMQGFRDEGGAGTMTITQAVESFPTATGPVPQPTVYYDAFESPIQPQDARVDIVSRAPAQSATGVTNASGTRNVNTASSYQMDQLVTDADGDINSQSLIYVSTSAATMGNWFQMGTYQTRTVGGFNNGTTFTAFYQSWNETPIYATAGSQLTTNYLTALTVSLQAQSSGDTGGGTGVTSQTVRYSVIFSAPARGTWNVFGRGEDWHGRTSGNVLVGTQTIS